MSLPIMDRKLIPRMWHMRNVNKILKIPLITLQCRPAASQSAQTNEQDLSTNFTNTEISSRVYKKKPQKPPFAKNLFLGRFDTDILAYPEILDNEELADRAKRMKPIQDYFVTLNTAQIHATGEIPPTVLNDIKSLGLFGQDISGLDGGMELNETEKCKIHEIVARDGSIAAIISSHQNLALKTIQTYGSGEQKEKYVRKLAAGDLVAAFCLAEPNTVETGLLQTSAVLNEEEDCWVLNGKKLWVVNGSNADLWVVVAQTQIPNRVGDPENAIVTLLVDKKCEGITTTRMESLGITASEMSSVTFTNTKIGKDKQLGELQSDLRGIVTILSANRLQVGAECTGILRSTIDEVTNYAIKTGTSERKLVDLEWAKKVMSQIMIKTYAIESMTYLTAGLQDNYENQDTDVESAIVKIFCSENSMSALEDCTSFYGPDSYRIDHFLHRHLKNIRRHLYFDEYNTLLRLYIALSGLQYAGKEVHDAVKKIRNPLWYPGHAVKKMWKDRGQSQDAPRLTLQLDECLHPSLRIAAQWAEYSVLRFHYACELLLARHGTMVIEKQMELNRLANVLIDIYAMVAVLGRSSRSYCIGLRNSDYEMLVASAFCMDAMARVKQNVMEIDRGMYGTNDSNYSKIGDKVFTCKGYFADHPTARNF